MENKQKTRNDLLNKPQESVVEWVKQSGAVFTHAVTLTFAEEVKDRIVAERRTGAFMHMLNDKLYRRAYESGSQRIKVFAVIEGITATHKRVHVHCALQMPEFASEWRVREEIRFCWKKANMKKDCKVDVREYINEGWIEYITKELKMTDTSSVSEHCYF